jgi:hypothetical protein
MADGRQRVERGAHNVLSSLAWKKTSIPNLAVFVLSVDRQGGRQMTRLMTTGLVLSIFVLALSGLAAAQDPCSEQGAGCRLMTSAEMRGLKERFLALQAALPVPDSDRYALANGVDETYTMPFVASANIVGGPLTCLSWPAGCFIEQIDVSFPYDVRSSDKPVEKPEPKDATEAALAAVQGMFGDIEKRVEVDASLLPYPYLVQNVDGKCVDVSDPEAVNIEKSPTFLSWESGDGTNLTMIFGPRTCKETETLRVEKPASNFAPVMCITLEISGPNAEVAALKKKINRQAFAALLGPVVK